MPLDYDPVLIVVKLSWLAGDSADLIMLLMNGAIQSRYRLVCYSIGV